MQFRIFLLIPALIATAVQAQESDVPQPAPVEAAAPAAPVTQVPLDPAALLAVGAPRSKAERDEMTERAATLQAEAKLRRETADATHETAKTACWKKFLVSDCLEDARIAHRKDVSLSKRQVREAQTLERNVRKYDALERTRIRDEENAKREAENAKKAEKHRARHSPPKEGKTEKQP